MQADVGIPQFIGVKVRRREDPNLITGKGKYVADIQLDGTLYMAVSRSPHGHARVVNIDTSAALEMEGVVAVLTGSDLIPHLAKPMPLNIPIDQAPYTEGKNPPRYPLATTKVRHVGDPVAVVVAEDPYIVADALEKIIVEYEPLQAVVTPEEALAEGAPLLYEEHGDNVAYRWSTKGGDPDAAFEKADVVIETNIVNQRVIPNPMEPRAVLADYDEETDSVTVWTTAQSTHSPRENLAAILDIPEDKIRIIVPEVGGGFGTKANIYGEEIIATFLTKKLKRPVKWVATRSEDYLATAHGRGQKGTIRLAADKEGHVQAIDLDIISDFGAYYTPPSPLIPTLSVLMSTGVYEILNLKAKIVGVFTNKHQCEPYRGAGRPEGIYLIERAMDVLADKLDIDPVELRRRNLIPPDKFPFTTVTQAMYDSGDYEKTLDKVIELIGYKALREEQERSRQSGDKLMGIGVANYIEICGFGPFEMGKVTVDEEGKVTVITGSTTNGQGHDTTWSQIASETLQIPAEDITVKHGDTNVVPRGVGTFGSRSGAVGGMAVLGNSETVREKAKKIAAHLLEAADVDITLDGKGFHVAGVPDRAVNWQAVAKAAQSETLPEELQGGLTADKDFEPKGVTFPFGTHACVVEIDKMTGSIEIVRYLTVDDCGKVINPMIVEGQVHGGIAQGVGQALMEEARYDESGNLLTGSLLDYSMPKAHHFPHLETHRTETPTPLNALGIKGIGEAATVGSTPTVANAVIDALSHLGVVNIDMPFTQEKIWKVLQENT